MEVNVWKTIESAPKDGSNILLWNLEYECPIVARFAEYINDKSNGHGYWQPVETLIADVIGEIDDATHWMAFELPQETK